MRNFADLDVVGDDILKVGGGYDDTTIEMSIDKGGRVVMSFVANDAQTTVNVWVDVVKKEVVWEVG